MIDRENDRENHRESAPDFSVDFIEPDGTKRRVAVLCGQSLMDAALAAGVAGIIGQCGGAINCATCLCDVISTDLPPQHKDEQELLAWVDEATTNSRLCCQLFGSPAIDGLQLRVLTTVA